MSVERGGITEGSKRAAFFATTTERQTQTPRRELRGSGARGYIIKKQETSSFSPALVKILNWDFMLPVCSSRAPRRHARAGGFPFRVPPRRAATRRTHTRAESVCNRDR